MKHNIIRGNNILGIQLKSKRYWILISNCLCVQGSYYKKN